MVVGTQAATRERVGGRWVASEAVASTHAPLVQVAVAVEALLAVLTAPAAAGWVASEVGGSTRPSARVGEEEGEATAAVVERSVKAEGPSVAMEVGVRTPQPEPEGWVEEETAVEH